MSLKIHKIIWTSKHVSGADISYSGLLGISSTHALPSQDILSQAEQKRHNKMKHEHRRHEFVTGRFTVKSLLSHVFPIEHFNAVHIEPNHLGNPFIQYPHAPFKVAIAHSLDRVGGMVYQNQWSAGLDIEKMDEKRNHFASSVHTEEEISLCQSLKCHAFAPLILWTVKEALMKYFGVGLLLGKALSTVSSICETDTGVLASYLHFPAFKARIFFQDDLIITCCYAGDFDMSVKLTSLSTSQFQMGGMFLHKPV